MDRSEVQSRLLEFVNGELLADRSDKSIQPDSPLFGGGGVDSLAIMRLVMFIERDLGVTMPLADLTPENFASVEVLSRYLGSRDLQAATG